jgi:hypothetical protein
MVDHVVKGELSGRGKAEAYLSERVADEGDVRERGGGAGDGGRIVVCGDHRDGGVRCMEVVEGVEGHLLAGDRGLVGVGCGGTNGHMSTL